MVRLVSDGRGEASFDLDSLQRDMTGWAEYAKGVAWALGAADLVGWDGAIVSEIPEGAGLSSSAALEMATALAFVTTSGRGWDPVAAALAGQRAENDWIGLSSGIMDQLIVATAEPGCATLIDCRSQSLTPIPLPPEVVVVILDTGTRRRLVDSEYQKRRESCRSASQAAGVAALRDLTVSDLPEIAELVDDVTYRRARHVITENARTLEAASALRSGDPTRFGHLMTESHRSLRDDYEVSTGALDTMVRIALEQDGCVGARMTGAGFGGCAIALVEEPHATLFVDEMNVEHGESAGHRSIVYRTRPARGTGRQSL